MSWFSKFTGGSAAKEAAPSASIGPASVLIGSHEHGLAELKVRSFRINPYDGDLIAHQNLRFVLKFSIDGEEVSFPGTGIVRSLDDQAGLMAQFTAPQPFYDRKLLAYLALQKLKGKKG